MVVEGVTNVAERLTFLGADDNSLRGKAFDLDL